MAAASLTRIVSLTRVTALRRSVRVLEGGRARSRNEWKNLAVSWSRHVALRRLSTMAEEGESQESKKGLELSDSCVEVLTVDTTTEL